MFCANCGAPVSGNFCSVCGYKIAQPTIVETPPDSASPGDLLTRLKDVLNSEQTRNLIAMYAKQSPKAISADDILKVFDLAFQPLAGVSVQKLTDVMVPIAQRIGIKTGKSSSEVYPVPITELLLKTLCSIAKNGYELKETQLTSDGIVLVCEIKSDIWTWGGNLMITLKEIDKTTNVIIDVEIKGQLYDWGKSNSIIQHIKSDLTTIKIN